MDALIKSLRPGKPSDVKSTEPRLPEPKIPEARPAELDPSEFLAAAVRADQPRPSRAEAEQAVQTLLHYIGENPDREGLLDTPRRVVEASTNSIRAIISVPPRCSTAPSGDRGL